MTRFSIASWMALILLATTVVADETTTAPWAIQQAEIAALKERVRQLEKLVKHQSDLLSKLQTASQPAITEPPTQNPKSPPEVTKDDASLKQQVKEWIAEQTGGLQLSGFFDLTAATRHSNHQMRQPNFSLGVFEVDLEFPYGEHFAVSAALDWDESDVSVGTALIDYHWFDDRIPPRGRIFQDQALHLQAGRFDVPYGIDYQFFATPDRTTITAPLSTERIQAGGFNSDGLRFYGTWQILDFTGYWVDSVYGSGGTSAGGRLALSLGRNPYRLHHHGGSRLLDIGFSILGDWDGSDRLANLVYGGDLTFNTAYFQLLAEMMYRNARQGNFDGNGNNLGQQDELAWHATLIFELEDWFDGALHPYLRYGRWHPQYSWVVDSDDNTQIFRVHTLSRLTAGLNLAINEYLALKLEYLTHLGGRTREPGFEHSQGLAQLVVNF